jgi:polar amino acid transport system substrate-binding protein
MVSKYLIAFIIFFAAIAGFYFYETESLEDREHTIIFATCADYPPFEYYTRGELQGFDIELGVLIAQHLNKQCIFKDMGFNSILPALEHGIVDAALSTMTVTPERQKNFDFSIPYYIESLSILSKNSHKIDTQLGLQHKKIACQIGTTMEIWLKNNAPNTEIISMDSNTSAVEALKSGHVDGVLIDTVQAQSFVALNTELNSHIIAQADGGYAVAMKKGSPLLSQINTALESLQQNGTIDRLKQKYIGHSHG